MTLTGEQCFDRWAPDESPWAAWAKPVLFSQFAQRAIRPDGGPPSRVILPPFARETAVIVDLPGQESVAAGLALAEQGWRPVPLFNATSGMRALVDLEPIMQALLHGAEELERLRIRPDAPPAFLVHADRMYGMPVPGRYDNRSVVLPQDLPSATFLLTHGIREVVLVHDREAKPRDDLAHVLLRWQQAGIALRYRTQRGASGELAVTPPSLFRKAWYRVIALMGLRRSNVGGFGALIPEQTAGGGGFG